MGTVALHAEPDARPHPVFGTPVRGDHVGVEEDAEGDPEADEVRVPVLGCGRGQRHGPLAQNQHAEAGSEDGPGRGRDDQPSRLEWAVDERIENGAFAIEGGPVGRVHVLRY